MENTDYLSSDQAIDSHKADARSDIYALGCPLKFLLTGRPPFPNGSPAKRILAHQTKESVPIDRCQPDISEEFRQMMDQMLPKDREQQIQSAKNSRSSFRRGWKLWRMIFSSSNGRTPTGSNRQIRLRWIGPGQIPFYPDSSPAAHGDSALSGVCTREFVSFLVQLNEWSGFDTVIDIKPRKQQLKTMRELRDARRRHRRRGG